MIPVLVHRPLLALALAVGLGTASWLLARRSWAEGSPLRRAASLACRCTLLALLALALSGVEWRRERPEVAVAFAIDWSDSARGTQARVREMLREAQAQARPGDRAAVVQFGRDALVERGLSEDLSPPELASAPEPDGSDLGAALRLTRGLLPADGRRRVVVMTDGAASGEDPVLAIRAMRDEGIDVALVPLMESELPEVLVDEVSAPERVHEGEPFEVRVVLRASSPASGTLTITRDGALLGEARVDVPAGAPAAFRFVDRPTRAGAHVYRAHFEAKPDGFEQNNAAEAIVRVEGEPSILVVDPDAAALAPFVALLQAAGLRVEAASPEALPRTIAEAGRHSAIVLSNVDSLHLSARQMETLRGFVREAGGGLLMCGGPESFGPGGWYRTPVEDVLPVDMDVRNQKYYPSLTLVLALDKSGSMAENEGVPKMDLAKEAARQTASLLQPGDRLGVIAFDSAAKWVVEPDAELSQPAIENLIGTIRAGGGTDIYPALVLAEESLAKRKTALRHLIVMSDGQSPSRDYEGVITRMKDAGVTTTAVAVGSDADLSTMKSFATWGGGRYYFTDDPASIPRIFTKEAFTTARSFVVEERLAPRFGRAHPVTRGVTSLGDVLGYVATTAKPSAEVVLVTPREDPLLAVRSFGLGRTAALTTDLGQRWSAAWMESTAGRTLLAQLMRWVSSRSDSPLLDASLERRGGRTFVSVEARDESGAFLDFADLHASVAGPDLAHQDVALRQVAPGRYEGEVADAGPGAWFAGVVQRSGDRVVRATSTARVFAYSDEYRTLQAPSDALGRLAVASGARLLPDVTRAFERSGPPALALRPAWREIVLLAAMLLLLDVALRRLMLPDGWAATCAAWVRARAPKRAAAAAPSIELSRLRQVKVEARADAEGPDSGRVAAAVSSRTVTTGAAGATLAAAPRGGVADAGTATEAPPATGARDASEAPTTALSSRLLAARRRAKSEPRRE